MRKHLNKYKWGWGEILHRPTQIIEAQKRENLRKLAITRLHFSCALHANMMSEVYNDVHPKSYASYETTRIL